MFAHVYKFINMIPLCASKILVFLDFLPDSTDFRNVGSAEENNEMMRLDQCHIQNNSSVTTKLGRKL
jgi:hypothetical protein